MELKEINPIEVNRPQGRIEKLFSFFVRDSASKGLVDRLRGIDTTVTYSGETREVSLEDIGSFIEDQKTFYSEYYPPGKAQYTRGVENDRRRVLKMERLFNDRNYFPLVKIFMNLARNEWKNGDLMDANWEGLSTKEKEAQRSGVAYNNELEAKVKAKERANPGYHGEHGYPPELLELGGDKRKQEAMQFLRYASVLAKVAVKS